MYSYAIQLDEHRQYLDFTSPKPYDWRLYNDFGIRMIEIIIYELIEAAYIFINKNFVLTSMQNII